MKTAACVTASLVLLASPAHAFITGDPNGGPKGAYTDQSKGGEQTFDDNGNPTWKGPVPMKTLYKDWQDANATGGQSLADAVAAAAAKSAEQK